MVKHAKAATETPEDRNDVKYKGVRKRKWGKWVSEIRLPNSRERIWLGSYDSAEKAARAFDAALFCLRGHSAKFNFPDNPPNIAGGRSLSPPEIQAAAAEFANSEHPQSGQLDPSVSELQVESLSPSPSTSVVSDLTAQVDGSELRMDTPFLDLLTSSGTCRGANNYAPDYEMFSGFDDNYFAPLPGPTIDQLGEENFDGAAAQDSFLWNF